MALFKCFLPMYPGANYYEAEVRKVKDSNTATITQENTGQRSSWNVPLGHRVSETSSMGTTSGRVLVVESRRLATERLVALVRRVQVVKLITMVVLKENALLACIVVVMVH